MRPARFHAALALLHAVAALGFALLQPIVAENLLPWFAGAVLLAAASGARAVTLARR